MVDELEGIEKKVKTDPQFTEEERALLHELVVLWRGVKSMGVVGKWVSAAATVSATIFLAIHTFRG